MGLLLLAAILRDHGYSVAYIDCLDRFHPEAPASDPRARSGRGPYLKTPIPKPAGLEDIPRQFSRYGILPRWLREDLAATPRPDLILVTSMMTYWHPGLQETVKAIREIFPRTPIVVGGVYATLLPDHARRWSGADQVFTGDGAECILSLAGDYTGFRVKPWYDLGDLDALPFPAFDLQNKQGFIPLMTSVGCPFKCAYCASRFLNPRRMTRQPASVASEIEYWHRKYGVSDFVFYDDALLVDAEAHAIPIFEEIIRSGLKVRFHTPNAIHIRGVSGKTAALMRRAGFQTVRLGLETVSFGARKELDEKVAAGEFQRAVHHLEKAGFKAGQVGAYLLVGLPGQSMREVRAAIRTVRQSGVTPIPAYYTPIPGTDLWPRAKAASRYDLESDPVFTNNAILPCRETPFSWESITRLKDTAAGRD
ncbi:MAG: B12-binding domain-containing radical SAM protein [Desulfobacterales bacterium]|nr:B12-binding domain-containing radical SAM protein [Desulfobacterales bacterium]